MQYIMIRRVGPDKHEHQGGYSTHVRAQERFVFPIPDELPSVEAASMYVDARTDSRSWISLKYI